MSLEDRRRKRRLTTYLATTLKQLRQDRGLTQLQVAKYCGREQQEVSLWEKDGSPPCYALPALSKLFSVPIETFFPPREGFSRDPGSQEIDWALHAAVAALAPAQRHALLHLVRQMQPPQGDEADAPME